MTPDDANIQKLVLIVDDDPSIRLLLGEALESAGFNVREAEDGEQALKLLVDCVPDLIMMDVMMPGLNGFEVCTRIRDNPDRSHIPIVLVTGNDDLASIQSAYDLGITDFITKPISWGVIGHRASFIIRATDAFYQLKKSEQRLAQAQRIAKIGSWEWVLESDKIWFSDEALRIFRLAPQDYEASYQSFISNIHPGDRRDVENAIINAVDYSGSYSIDHQLSLADGTTCYVHTEAEVIKDRHGTPIRLEGTIQDITERKQVEETLRRSESDLAAAQAISHVGSWRLFFDEDGEKCTGSDELYRIYGYPRDMQLTTKSIEDRIHPEDLEYVKSAWSAAITGDGPCEWEYRITVNGRIKWLNVRMQLVFGPDGKLKESTGSVQDISDIKLAEGHMLQAKADAESANRAKSEFLANMSHEIRTPIHGVLGIAQILAMSELTEEQREYVDVLNRSGNNLLALINDILDLSKIEAGKVQVESAVFSPCSCINDITMLLKKAIDDKGLILEVNVDNNVPSNLIGDQLRVKQILFNLLGNAVKFTSQGSIAVTLQALEQNNSSVLLKFSIRDTGIGISAEALETIFKPFVQEDGSTTRKYGGTGLGLYISRRLAELMGGSISVESTPGKGSCFMVTLPYQIGKKTCSVEDIPQKAKVSWDGPALRILFVEDHPVNIKILMCLLNKLGHDVVSVENGEDCLAVMQHEVFDLVLMDIQMPVMNGKEALRGIRTREQTTSAHIPVIALTAYALRGEKEDLLKEGFDGYVSKPLVIGELISEMKRVLA